MPNPPPPPNPPPLPNQPPLPNPLPTASDDAGQGPPEPQPGDEVTFVIAPDDAGGRLDVYLAHAFANRSRSFLARAIEKGAVRVDGVTARASLKLRAGSLVRFTVPQPPRDGPAAEEIPLDFLHCDEWMAVVNKPAGMVVHPAKGNWKGTLAGALKWHLERGDAGAGLSTAGGSTRPGIVHRLDRDTSGVIVVARTEEAHHALAKQFEQRTTIKTYLALTQTAPQFDRDEINLPIGIHPYQREKMAVRRDHPTSREAVTRFEVLERFRGGALVCVTPKTGRTHQIRVHLAAIGCPVLCDGLYSGRTVIEPSFLGLPAGPPLLERQALHAASIEIDHPVSRERLTFSAPLPADMERMLAAFRGTGPVTASG
ncbi:MAG: RluA family pseudouridine synthase [Planctomycetia bacterium]|nr:RluA family pseudouridine synthase [Planctomycetia bacterium]